MPGNGRSSSSKPRGATPKARTSSPRTHSPRKKVRTKKADRNLDRVMALLWERADEGNVTATKALYDHYRRLQGPARDEEPPAGDRESVEAAIYGDGHSNVTPIRKRTPPAQS